MSKLDFADRLVMNRKDELPKGCPLTRIKPDERQTPAVPNRYRATHESPPKPGGEGWLVNGDEQLLVRFSNDNPTAHGQWVILSTYRWVRPHPPVPQSQRRMLRHNAVEAWKNMQMVGWRRCHPPVR